MTIEEFIQLVEEEFDDLDPGLLLPESKFREKFEWNSINALILIAVVKTEYDVILTADDLIRSVTVQNLYDIVKGRIQE
ncbi:MAG: acyl carrier protein [Bacteroidales bacterium]|nr:acyl carrier protein [Bacteroidales bacterium]